MTSYLTPNKIIMNQPHHPISRRHFMASAGLLSAGFFVSPSKLFDETSPVTIIINEAAKGPVNMKKLRNNISMLEGSGGNIAVFTGRDGKLLVDGGIDVSKEKMKKVLSGISKEPVKYLINTHWHFDHASGNEWLHEAGATIMAHGNTKKNLSKQIRVEDWKYTFPPAPKGALPTITFEKERTLQMNGETIQMHYYGPAHTDSDISVYFENADVLHVADTWWNGYYPFIDYDTKGNIDGMLKAANANVNLATDKTIIIPGHGPVGNKAQLTEYRDMLVEVKTKIEAMKKQGKSLKEVVASKPTKSYDAKWGNFVINGDFFTNLVYRSV
jgi:glyoxylase-like metal-dependent hydrolase (beta-lactamase superfamily II)